MSQWVPVLGLRPKFYIPFHSIQEENAYYMQERIYTFMQPTLSKIAYWLFCYC